MPKTILNPADGPRICGAENNQVVDKNTDAAPGSVPAGSKDAARDVAESGQRGEIGGPAGLEPTRYGDWEVKGRCSDF
jgi:hypothetical protein